MEEWDAGKMWPFSCYGPNKSKESLPGMARMPLSSHSTCLKTWIILTICGKKPQLFHVLIGNTDSFLFCSCFWRYLCILGYPNSTLKLFFLSSKFTGKSADECRLMKRIYASFHYSVLLPDAPHVYIHVCTCRNCHRHKRYRQLITLCYLNCEFWKKHIYIVLLLLCCHSVNVENNTLFFPSPSPPPPPHMISPRFGRSCPRRTETVGLHSRKSKAVWSICKFISVVIDKSFCDTLLIKHDLSQNLTHR